MGSAISFQAILGERFFLGLIGTGLALVLLLAPATTAGAICVDRARGTLVHMLVTDLSAAEIVLGKLAARLAPVIGVLACTFPVLEILTLLGGVDPDAILGAYVVTVGVAVLSCSLAMTFSLWARKAHEALLSTYLVLFLWLLAGPMIDVLGSTNGRLWLPLPRSFEPFFLALAPYWSPGTVGWGDYLLFLAAICSISAALSGVAILRIRAVCRHDSVPNARRSNFWLRGGNIWRFVNKSTAWLGPSLDSDPIVWREWRRSFSSRWMFLIAITYAGLSILLQPDFARLVECYRSRGREWGPGLGRPALARRDGRVVTKRGAGGRKSGPVADHSAFDAADHHGKVAGCFSCGPAAGDRAGFRDRCEWAHRALGRLRGGRS